MEDSKGKKLRIGSRLEARVMCGNTYTLQIEEIKGVISSIYWDKQGSEIAEIISDGGGVYRESRPYLKRMRY